jgi:hypothetical protein
MTRRVALAGLLALALATHARAAFITGVTASTNMGSGAGSDIAHIVDGSGLSSQSLTATHAAGLQSTSWLSNIDTLTGQVTFDLHGAYTLVGMSVWNFNALNTNGVQGVNVSTSTDGVTFTTLSGGPTTFAKGANLASEAPQQFTFGPVVADFVRFNITSNYGSLINTGLSEVAFNSTAVPTGVPAPPTLLLGLVAVGVTGVARLRRRGALVARQDRCDVPGRAVPPWGVEAAGPQRKFSTSMMLLELMLLT